MKIRKKKDKKSKMADFLVNRGKRFHIEIFCHNA